MERRRAKSSATPFQTFRKVTLPQLAPGILGGALLAFIISMDDLVITYLISGAGSQTLPIFVFSMVRRGVGPDISAIVTLIIHASAIVAATGLWLRAGGSRE